MFFHTGRLGEQSPFCFSFFSLSLSLCLSSLSDDFHVTSRIPHARTSIVAHAFQGSRGCTWVERVPTFSARKRSLPKGTHARDDPAVWSLPRASSLFIPYLADGVAAPWHLRLHYFHAIVPSRIASIYRSSNAFCLHKPLYEESQILSLITVHKGWRNMKLKLSEFSYPFQAPFKPFDFLLTISRLFLVKNTKAWIIDWPSMVVFFRLVFTCLSCLSRQWVMFLANRFATF